MALLTPKEKLLEDLKSYTNRSRHENSHETLTELKHSISAVDVDDRFSILTKPFKRLNTILHRAAGEGEIDVFKLVIDSVPVESKFDLLKAQNTEGKTPLHLLWLSDFGKNIQHVLAGLSQENVTELLRIQSHSKLTLLHKASWADTSKPLEHLLGCVKSEDKFELIKTQDKDGWTVLACSVATNDDTENKVRCVLKTLSHEECMQLFQIKFKNKLTVLHSIRTAPRLKFMLEEKQISSICKVQLFQVQDGEGNTPLHKACLYNSSEVVKYILDGLSLDRRLQLLKTTNEKKRNPLHLAAANNGAKLFELLLANMPPVEMEVILSMQDGEGNTAFGCAVKKHSPSTIQAIIDLVPTKNVQSILNIPNYEKKTAMDLAVADNFKSAISLLQKCTDKVEKESVEDFSTDGNSSNPLQKSTTQDGRLKRNELPEPSKPLSYSLVTATSRAHDQPLPSLLEPKAPSNSGQLPYPQAHQLLSKVEDLSNTTVSTVGKAPASFAGFLQPPLNVTKFVELSPVPRARLSYATTSFPSTSRFTHPPSSWSDRQPPGTSLGTSPCKGASAEQFSGPPEGGAHAMMNTTSPSSKSHHFLPDVLNSLNNDDSLHVPGSKRPAPSEASTQPAKKANSAKTDQDNEGKVQGHTLRLMYQGKGYLFSFKPDNTVEQLTQHIKKATTASSIFKDLRGYRYTKHMTLDLVEPPFVIFLDGVKVDVTGSVAKRELAKSDNQPQTSQSATGQQKSFGRVNSVQEVVDLLSFVHENMKKGKSVNKALKLAKKDRKTVDRFVNIYYLHGQNRERMEELETRWVKDRKPQGLQGLDELAKVEINWTQLQQLFVNCSLADFRLKKDRLEEDMN